MARPRAHFPCTGGGFFVFWPIPLDSFTAGPADAFNQVERILIVAFLLVSAKVVHWDRIADIDLVLFDTEGLREFEHSSPEVNGPLANDVVGENFRREVVAQFMCRR